MYTEKGILKVRYRVPSPSKERGVDSRPAYWAERNCATLRDQVKGKSEKNKKEKIKLECMYSSQLHQQLLKKLFHLHHVFS